MPTTTGAHWPRPSRSPVRMKRRACLTSRLTATLRSRRGHTMGWDGAASALRQRRFCGDKRDFPFVAEHSAVRSGGARAEVSPRRTAS